METETILTELTEIFIDVMDNEDISLQLETTANDVEDWDSLSHIQLIYAIEKHFGLKFTTASVQAFKSVGDMVAAIRQFQLS
ncbi:MAG: acyl carrier protein [Bacteroidota bacterium]